MSNQKHYLYVFEMIGYAKHGNPKVGVTKNVKSRERQLWYSYGGLIPKPLALYEFSDVLAARKAELAVIQNFTPYLPPARELFCEPCEVVIDFIARSKFPCQKVDIA